MRENITPGEQTSTRRGIGVTTPSPLSSLEPNDVLDEEVLYTPTNPPSARIFHTGSRPPERQENPLNSR